MKFKQNVVTAMIGAALITVTPAISATIPNPQAAQVQMVITVLPAPAKLEPADLMVKQGKLPLPVTRLQRLTGDLADMQLFILLDDSTRSSSLGIQLPRLKTFVESLPATTQVAIGYMRNGTFGQVQPFTADHQKAADALRLPLAVPGDNGSPYFALSDLAKHWPSKESTNRRAVLMLTDGVDRYYGSAVTDDPYVNESVHDTLKDRVMVYSIYLRGAGLYGQGTWTTNVAQSRLLEVSEQTGGYAYFQGFTDPVSIAPFLTDFEARLDNQYEVTMQAFSGKGVQLVKVQTELPGLKIQAPSRIYLRN
jgi:hypothetical protein